MDMLAKQAHDAAVAKWMKSNDVTVVRAQKSPKIYQKYNKDYRIVANFNAAFTREVYDHQYFKLVNAPLKDSNVNSTYIVSVKDKESADFTTYYRTAYRSVKTVSWTILLQQKVDRLLKNDKKVNAREKYLVVKHSDPALFKDRFKDSVSNVYEIQWDSKIKAKSKSDMLISFDPFTK